MPDDARDPLICLRIPPGLDARLRADVERQGTSISEAVRSLIEFAYPSPHATPQKPARKRASAPACTHRIRTGSFCKRCDRVV